MSEPGKVQSEVGHSRTGTGQLDAVAMDRKLGGFLRAVLVVLALCIKETLCISKCRQDPSAASNFCGLPYALSNFQGNILKHKRSTWSSDLRLTVDRMFIVRGHYCRPLREMLDRLIIHRCGPVLKMIYHQLFKYLSSHVIAYLQGFHECDF